MNTHTIAELKNELMTTAPVFENYSKDYVTFFLNNAQKDANQKNAAKMESGEEKSRCEQCGMTLTRANPATGKMITVRTKCHMFRECAKCRAYRNNHYKNQVDTILKESDIDHLNCAILSAAELSAFDYQRKKLNAAYTRIPLSDDGTVLVITTSDELAAIVKFGFQQYSSESIKETLEQFVSEIPEGTRITGNLFTAVGSKEEDEEEETDEETINITAHQFLTDATDDELHIATLEGYVAVSNEFSIVNKNNLQSVNDVFIGAIKAHLIGNGIYVQNQGFKNCTVRVSQINWPKVEKQQRINRREQIEEINVYAVDSKTHEQLDSKLQFLVEIQE